MKKKFKIKKNDKITRAKGIKGFLIPSVFDHNIYFRVYDKKKNFIDYEIGHPDCEVEIKDDDAVLINSRNRNILFSAYELKKKK